MSKELSGRTVFVTGSGRGLGRAMAERLCELGADVAIHDMDWNAPSKYNEAPDLGAVAADIGMRTARRLCSPKELQPMPAMEFQVCYRSREARWVVTLGNSLYGAYLDKEQALLDAVDAARDALEVGREAQVWLREQQSPARVF